MRLRNRFLAVLVLAAVLIGVATTSANAAEPTPAPAAISQGAQVAPMSVTDCGSNLGMCIWATSDYSGAFYHWTPVPAANTCTALGGVWNNVARSLRIVTPGKKVRLFTNSNCTGSFVTSMITGTFQATCLNTLSNWYVAASPCTGPTASSFYVYP